MSYLSNRERIRQLIQDSVLNLVKRKDLDYYQVISFLRDKTGSSQELIAEVLSNFIPRQLKETRTLTIPDSQIPDYLSQIIEEDKQNQILTPEKVQEILLDSTDK